MAEPTEPNDRAPAKQFDSANTRLGLGFRSLWPESVTLGVFAAVVAYAIPFHEPWADEAQAWELARTLPLSELFGKYIHYEGSPGLWHFLLWTLNRAHVSYAGMHWVCGAIAVASTSLLIFKSPFPRYLRLALPFIYALIFQDALVARSYVLVPPCLFLIAMWWKKRPMSVALALGLLANLSLHAAVISGALAIVYLVEQVRKSDARGSGSRRRLIVFSLILLPFYGFAIWCARPPRDMAYYLAGIRGQSHSFMGFALKALLWPMCQPMLLSIIFWIAIILCLKARRRLIFLLPVLFFAVFSGEVLAAWWHAALLPPVLLCILWITWPENLGKLPRYELFCRVALMVMAATQIAWAAYALGFDHASNFSPDRATAEFLKPYVEQNATIVVTYLNEPPANNACREVGIQPYFEHNIFANLSHSFWWWSDTSPAERNFDALLPSHPRVIVAEDVNLRERQPVLTGNSRILMLSNAGYTLTNVFCGTMPERLEPGPTSCHLIFQYLDGKNPSAR